ncbi:MAG: NUDIX domain-containing protein [Brachybacterium sp.]|nr:NUDIX domain-containing protein [Brachybacterium sp.]
MTAPGRTTVPMVSRAPEAGRAIAELTDAPSPAIDESVRADYVRLLRRVPGALHREGDAFGADGRRVHLTASAYVVDATADHLALLWHRKGSFWVQPGGHIDAGETSLEGAARREVAEEIGLTDLQMLGGGPVELQRHDLSEAFGACGAHWDVRYLFRADAPAAELTLQPCAETPEVRWVPWPRTQGGQFSTVVPLPEGTVPDLAGVLSALAPHMAGWVSSRRS